MNGTLVSRIAILGAGVVLLAACATPAPIRSLADQGAATVGLAEASLREYLATTNAQLTARMDLLRYDAQRLAKDRSARELDLLIDKRAGVDPTDADAKLIRSLGAAHREAREKREQELEKIAKETQLDPAALTQAPSEHLAGARKSFSVLAQELSSREWVQLYVSYAKEIKTGIEQLDPPAPPPSP
jgi:hypothetical protein